MKHEHSYLGKTARKWSEEIRSTPTIPYDETFVSTIVMPASRTTWDKLRFPEMLGWKKSNIIKSFPTRDRLSFPLRDGNAKAIPILVELLDDPSAMVRIYSIETIGEFGEMAASAIPALTTAVKQDKGECLGVTVKDKALSALEKIKASQEGEKGLLEPIPLFKDRPEKSVEMND